MLFPLPDGHTAESVRVALAATVQRLPEHLGEPLTRDQGKEMAQHAQFTVDTRLRPGFGRVGLVVLLRAAGADSDV